MLVQTSFTLLIEHDGPNLHGRDANSLQIINDGKCKLCDIAYTQKLVPLGARWPRKMKFHLNAGLNAACCQAVQLCKPYTPGVCGGLERIPSWGRVLRNHKIRRVFVPAEKPQHNKLGDLLGRRWKKKETKNMFSINNTKLGRDFGGFAI